MWMSLVSTIGTSPDQSIRWTRSITGSDYNPLSQASVSVQAITKLVHEGKYVAEVKAELLDTDEGWSPYLSLEDADKPDNVRHGLLSGDTGTAARYGKVLSSRR